MSPPVGENAYFQHVCQPVFNSAPFMDITIVIRQYAEYDRWASTRIADRLAREPDGLLDTPLQSSFPSLRATLMHVRNAHAAWFQRMSGIPQQWPAEPSDELGTFLKHVNVMCGYATTLPLEALMGDATYTDLKGNAHTTPRWQPLMHCFNHGSYHRGQIVSMMRQLGLDDIPATDLVVYQRLLKKGGA
ncbi:MAG: hypothetical protein JST41_09105 [Bacteroidetes bacterium]|nr:hypothetical protein [Bacteroidota bacterium]HMZ47532.1 DinB family protein [Flavobacteriales bacterium]HNA31793.1 DinB family protein [Flavobacteriales bacterium]HNK39603.1 DinB family protein [Flavobacteriales bacterium]HNK68910.1 DinB family protein [Flavobacteriales bacterium]